MPKPMMLANRPANPQVRLRSSTNPQGLPRHRLPLMPSQNSSPHVPSTQAPTPSRRGPLTRLPTEACAAFVGIDWADAKHDVCLQAAGSQTREFSVLEPQPDTIEAWVSTGRLRFKGQPMASWRELTKGPIVAAVAKYDVLVLCPVTPLTRARYREAFTPRHAKDDPSDAALPRELLRTPRDQLQPRPPQSPAIRALAPLVEPRRRLVGDNVRLTTRRTSARHNDFPHGLHGFDDNDTTRFCDFLTPWPPLNAVQLARRSPLERFGRAHPGRDADVIAPRIQAIKRAPPLTTDAGGIAPPALVVHALVSPLRVTVHAIDAFDAAIAPRAQSPPAFPWCDSLPGAGAV
jgi:Transposase